MYESLTWTLCCQSAWACLFTLWNSLHITVSRAVSPWALVSCPSVICTTPKWVYSEYGQFEWQLCPGLGTDAYLCLCAGSAFVVCDRGPGKTTAARFKCASDSFWNKIHLDKPGKGGVHPHQWNHHGSCKVWYGMVMIRVRVRVTRCKIINAKY